MLAPEKGPFSFPYGAHTGTRFCMTMFLPLFRLVSHFLLIAFCRDCELKMYRVENCLVVSTDVARSSDIFWVLESSPGPRRSFSTACAWH